MTRSAVGPEQEAQAWEDVRAEVAAGHQAYVVCPLIDESEKLEVASAEETYDAAVAPTSWPASGSACCTVGCLRPRRRR